MESFDLRYKVPLVPQRTGMSCWAAGAAMLVSWRDKISVNPKEVAKAIGYWKQYQQGLSPEDTTMFAHWGLIAQPPQSYTIGSLRKLLESKGPLWVASAVPGAHIRVITGMHGYGRADNTHIMINDPWDIGKRVFKMPNSGSQYVETFGDFEMKQRKLANRESAAGLYIAHNP